MLQILSTTAPIFILIGLGYLSVMTGLISRETTRGMGLFVITIALPAMILRGMVNKPLRASLDMDFLMGYALASILLFAMGALVFRYLRRASATESSLAGLGMSSANTGFIGLSICTVVLGTEPASRAVAMSIMVETMLMYPLTLALADAATGHGGQRALANLFATLKRLSRNPLLITIAVGLFLAVFQIPLPDVALQSIDMLAMTAAPVGLFAVGGNLHGLRPAGMVADASGIALSKLILHPAITAVVFMLFPGLDPVMRKAGLLFAASPLLSIYPIIGMRYGLEDRCSTALLLCTVLSFVSISIMIALIS
ncbi:MAG: AEC family transporter [Burkholderiaceae bacterium]